MLNIKKIDKSINIIKYKNYCNLCNEYFTVFHDAGEPVRKAVRCSICNSLERHRLQWEYITNETDMLTRKGVKLLHVSPEMTYYNKLSLIKTINYTGIDIDPKHLGLEDLNVEVGDVRKMRFKDNYFDFIICNHVLEHIIEDSAAMKELRRVLKKDGQAIIDVPIDYSQKKTYEDDSITKPEDRFKAFGQDDHVRMYGNDFFKRMKDAGFNVKKISYQENIGPIKRRRLGLQKYPLIIARKAKI